MTKAYTHDNDDEIAASYLSGESGYSIGRRYGITDGAVYNALKRKGIARRDGGTPTTWKDTEDNRRDLIAAYDAGGSVLSVARRFGIHTRRVMQVLDESGHTDRHPGGKRRFTDEDAAEFARAYQSGENLTQIGQRYGVAAQVVRRYLIQSGVPIRPAGAPAFWTDERKAEARRYYLAGHQLQDIAKVMGCGHDTLVRTLVELGVHKKPPRRSGETHHSWQGGRIVSKDGYVRVRVTDADRPLADVTRSGYVLEHRLVMARLLGRRLLKSETVHHIDNNRQYNEPGNLQLRQGKHGKGAVFRCASCGSRDIETVPLA